MLEHELPSVDNLAASILTALSDLNGEGSDSQILMMLNLEYSYLSESALGILHKGNNTKTEYSDRIDTAQKLLLKAEYVTRSQDGIWKVTKPESELTASNLAPLLVKAKQEIEAEALEEQVRNQPPKEYPEDRIADFRDAVLQKLKQMDALQFERLTAKLLRLCGFDSLPGKGTGDGGIDGVGYYKVNGILTYKIIIQCKRYDHPIQPSFVRDLRGVVSHQADKGLFVTTSTFTRASIEEAKNHPLIDLIDGQQFVDLMIQYNLGVKTTQKMFYKFDDKILERVEL